MDTSPVWVTANGKVIELNEIDAGHLERIIAMINQEDLCLFLLTDTNYIMNMLDREHSLSLTRVPDHVVDSLPSEGDLPSESAWLLDRKKQVDCLLTSRQRLVTFEELKKRSQELRSGTPQSEKCKSLLL